MAMSQVKHCLCCDVGLGITSENTGQILNRLQERRVDGSSSARQNSLSTQLRTECIVDPAIGQTILLRKAVGKLQLALNFVEGWSQLASLTLTETPREDRAVSLLHFSEDTMLTGGFSDRHRYSTTPRGSS